MCRAELMYEGNFMSKGKDRGNRETKKPKKVVAKVLATSNLGSGKADTVIAGKKIK